MHPAVGVHHSSPGVGCHTRRANMMIRTPKARRPAALAGRTLLLKPADPGQVGPDFPDAPQSDPTELLRHQLERTAKAAALEVTQAPIEASQRHAQRVPALRERNAAGRIRLLLEVYEEVVADRARVRMEERPVRVA